MTMKLVFCVIISSIKRRQVLDLPLPVMPVMKTWRVRASRSILYGRSLDLFAAFQHRPQAHDPFFTFQFGWVEAEGSCGLHG